MELLVMIRDKPYPADHPPEKAACLEKRGYVISAQPDGSWWSEYARTSPMLTIISAPISRADADSLLTREIGDPKTQILRMRGFKLDLDALSVTDSGTRTTERTTKTRNAVRNAKVQLTPLTR